MSGVTSATQSQISGTETPAAGWNCEAAHKGVDDFFTQSKETIIDVTNTLATASIPPLVNLGVDGLKLLATATCGGSAPSLHGVLESSRGPLVCSATAVAPNSVKSTMNCAIPLSATATHKSVDLIDRSVQWFKGDQ